MPYWNFLLEVRGPAPSPDGAALRELAAAADITPLGWLALFAPTDIHTVPTRDRARADDESHDDESHEDAYLTLFAPIPAARANLARRRAVLGAALRPPVAEWLDLLDEHLARLDPRHCVQVWLGELVYPWPASARAELAAVLAALDGDDRRQWARVADDLLAELRDGSIELRLPHGTQVNACVGWLSGEPAPREADELYPRIDDAIELLGQRGAGPSGLWQRIEDLLRELAPIDPVAYVAAEALRDRLDHEPPGWLRDQLPRAPAAVRAAILARGLDLPREELEYDEPDPDLRRAQFVVLVARADLTSPTGLVLDALRDPDPRVRAALARRYRSDLEDDEAIAEDDDVWRALIRDPEPRVRLELLLNTAAPIVPPVDDPSPLVRARHPETTPAELLRLAGDTDPDVLYGVLANRRSPLRACRRVCRSLGLE